MTAPRPRLITVKELEFLVDQDRLCIAIARAIDDLEAEHQPLWYSDDLKARGFDPVGCVICFPKDGGWPCSSRLIAQDLQRALAQEDSDE